MVIYNVTVGIDLDVESDWLKWMIAEHIPKVMATKLFNAYDVYKVITHEGDGASYSVQYQSDSIENVERYLGEFAPDLIREHMERYRNKHVAFRTLLEKVD